MNLEDTLALLKINDKKKLEADPQLEGNIETKKEENLCETSRRSTRLKSQINYSEKRRVCIKPKKLAHSEIDPENYYLDKRIKNVNPLETIYEDSNADNCMSKRKLHRKINFKTVSKKEKPTKRKMKAHSVSSLQRLKNKQKIPLDYLLETLNKVDK